MVYPEETRQDGYEKLGTSEEKVKGALTCLFISQWAAARTIFKLRLRKKR